MISTSSFDIIRTSLLPADSPSSLGHLLSIVCLISYLGSAVAFLFAGLNYKRLYINLEENDDGNKSYGSYGSCCDAKNDGKS